MPTSDEKCKEEVTDSRGWHRHQCFRKAKKGGYCTQHHPDTIKARRKASSDKYEAEWKAKEGGWARDKAMKAARDAVIAAAREYEIGANTLEAAVLAGFENWRPDDGAILSAVRHLNQLENAP